MRMKPFKDVVTHDELRSMLSYDPCTGQLTWIDDRGCGMRGKRAGCETPRGYRVVSVKDRSFAEHRVIYFWMTGQDPPEQIDHINRVRSDNRWSNLRPATRFENCVNALSSNQKSGRCRGVTHDRVRNRWRVRIRVNGDVKLVGYFKTETEAGLAYQRASKQYHGEFSTAA